MTKEISKKGQDGLVKTSPKASVELSETELEKVSGGRKAGGNQQEYLKVELKDVLIS